jgi:hypothetical protein
MVVHAQPKVGNYLDCGTARVTTETNRSVEVPVAKAFQQFRQRVNGVDYSVWRSMYLKVVTRLEVSPRPDTAPGASVRYAPIFFVTRERLVTSEGRTPMIFRDAIQFAAGEAAAFPNASTPCRSNGRLERELREILLDLEQPRLATGKPARRHAVKPAPRGRKPAASPSRSKAIVAERGAVL